MSTLNFVLKTDITQFEKDFRKVSNRLKKTSNELTNLGANLVFVTDYLKGMGRMALQASKQYQEAFKKIRVGTGATGEALNGLLADFKKVNAQTSQSTEQVAAALADLNTRLGLTGEPLQKMTLAVAEASRMTGQEMSSLANEAAKAMNAMGISGDQGAAMIDRLFVASQNTNIGMSELATMTAKYSGVLQATGLSLEQSIAMLSSFSNAGLNVKNVMSGITAAMNKFAKAGVKDAGAELNKAIEAIRSAATESQAAKLAVETFGASGTAMAQAIRTGHFEVGELAEKLRNSQGAVEAASKETATFADSWARTQKNLMTALEPLGTALLSLGEKYVIPAVQWLGGFTAAGNETVVMLGALAVAAGPVTGALGGFYSILRMLLTVSAKTANFLMLKGALSQICGAASLAKEEIVKFQVSIVNGTSTLGKFALAGKGMISFLTGPGGLLLALSSVAAYFAYDYVSSTNRAKAETEAFRTSVEKLAQSLSALSGAQLKADYEKAVSERNAAKAKYVDAAIKYQQVSKRNAENDWYFQTYTAADPSDRDKSEKEFRQKQKIVDTYRGEITLREHDPELNAIKQQYLNAITKNLSTKEVKALADKATEQIDSIVKTVYDPSGKLAQAADELKRGINANAKSYVPVTNTGYTSPSTKSAKTPKVSAPKDDLLERLRWQNSAGFLSDADYQAALASRFQSLTGGKGYETWSKDARSVYDELERLKKSQASKTAETLKWQNSAGFLGDDQYAASLEQRLASLTGGADFSKWSEEARGVFDELQRVMSEQLAPSLDSLKERFANGQITLGEYETQLESLKTKYQEYPAITKDLQKEMDAAKKSSQTFLSGMTAAIKDAKASFDNLSVTVGTGLADGFARAIAYGEDLGSTLQKLGQDIIYTVTKMLLLQSITRMFGGLFGGGGNSLQVATGYQMHFSGLDSGWDALTAARGRAFGPAGLVPFASGGIVGRPTLFKFAGGTGLMGEAGPEAIMPLQRDSQGRLGVSVANNAQAAGIVTYAPVINVNVENNGSGEMSAQQANQMSRQVRDVVDARIADQLSEYKRRGFFHAGAYA